MAGINPPLSPPPDIGGVGLVGRINNVHALEIAGWNGQLAPIELLAGEVCMTLSTSCQLPNVTC